MARLQSKVAWIAFQGILRMHGNNWIAASLDGRFTKFGVM
jgi:hypothetical protein